MDVYVFQGDLLCTGCAGEVMANLRARGLEPVDPVLREDSDTWPVGPYPHGGGEADSPQHCGGCGIFLGNPLTPKGEQYVLECAQRGRVPKDWLAYYGYLFGEGE